MPKFLTRWRLYLPKTGSPGLTSSALWCWSDSQSICMPCWGSLRFLISSTTNLKRPSWNSMRLSSKTESLRLRRCRNCKATFSWLWMIPRTWIELLTTTKSQSYMSRTTSNSLSSWANALIGKENTRMPCSTTLKLLCSKRTINQWYLDWAKPTTEWERSTEAFITWDEVSSTDLR